MPRKKKPETLEELYAEKEKAQEELRKAKQEGIVFSEILLLPNAPPEYADRNILWNAVEKIEKQWNSRPTRGFRIAIPREIPKEQYDIRG